LKKDGKVTAAESVDKEKTRKKIKEGKIKSFLGVDMEQQDEIKDQDRVKPNIAYVKDVAR
jgi:hypothetical protein